MNEFIKKLIGRLEEEIKKINDDPWIDCEERIKKQCIYCNTIKIVNQLAEEQKEIMNYNTLLNDIKSQLKQFIADSNNIDYNRALVEAIEVIDKKTEEYNGGWIPTSERLPEEDGRYLVTWKEDWGNGRFECFVFKCEYACGEWSIQEKDERYSSSVIAWQPLHAPYNPKGE